MFNVVLVDVALAAADVWRTQTELLLLIVPGAAVKTAVQPIEYWLLGSPDTAIDAGELIPVMTTALDVIDVADGTPD